MNDFIAMYETILNKVMVRQYLNSFLMPMSSLNDGILHNIKIPILIGRNTPNVTVIPVQTKYRILLHPHLSKKETLQYNKYLHINIQR